MSADGYIEEDRLPPTKSKILGADLECTCWACPEQYNVFKDGIQIGYLRLRHGHFRANYPEHGGEIVYEADTEGDGTFDDAEREVHLTKAVAALLKRASSGEGVLGSFPLLPPKDTFKLVFKPSANSVFIDLKADTWREGHDMITDLWRPGAEAVMIREIDIDDCLYATSVWLWHPIDGFVSIY